MSPHPELGATVKAVIEGVVRWIGPSTPYDDDPLAVIHDSSGRDHYVRVSGDTSIEALYPTVQPGQVWKTPEADLYFVRVSRRDLPLRMTPSDLDTDSGLKTMAVAAFFEKWPSSTLAFDPGDTKASSLMRSSQRFTGPTITE